MADRPAFQFYPADWRKNANLRRCSLEARGAWMDLLCILHDSDEYGVLRWPLVDVAQAAGVPIKLVRELVAKSVLKGADSGAGAYTFTPRHAGRAGEPVTLLAASEGPCWYCSRFVRDEYVRQRRGAATQFTADNQPPKAAPQPKPKATPKPPIGERQGDGPSSASASASTTKASVPTEPPADAAADPIWGSGLAFLIRKGVSAAHARSLLGKLRKEAGDVRLIALLAQADQEDISDPIAWLSAAALRPKRPTASDDFRGKTYAATADDDLPESLR